MVELLRLTFYSQLPLAHTISLHFFNTTNSTIMKHQAFIASVLAALDNVAAKQLAPVKVESWCITYLSTYLVPLQASSNLTEIAEATEYSNLIPTLEATTAENFSSITTRLSTGISSFQQAGV
jgi:hypothetical protein